MNKISDNPYLKPGRAFTQTMANMTQFPHTCDMWKPTTFSVDPVTKLAADPLYIIAVRGQRCRFVNTPETDSPTVDGRSKDTNIFTLDDWYFPVGVPIEDTWVIKLTFARIVDDLGQFWMCTGNPQSQEGNPFQLIGTQQIKARICPAPKGVS